MIKKSVFEKAAVKNFDQAQPAQKLPPIRNRGNFCGSKLWDAGAVKTRFFNHFRSIYLIFGFCFLFGCSGMEQSEQEKLRRLNAKGEFIHRQKDEHQYSLSTPNQYIRDAYPWEKRYAGKHPKITKDYFRCKGSSVNPPHIDNKDPSHPSNYFDCGGFQKHSLPIKQAQEFIYPVLIDLLNYLQEKTGSKVVITCGHRCPVHNAYADPSKSNQHSKHMIGAEVDFYVQGFEQKPEEIINLLIAYYKDQDKSFQEFGRLDKGDWNVSTPPWANKEILIKLYKSSEGRDFDNRHPYPYIGIQVRFDRNSAEKVICDWQKAFNGYQRF